MRYTQIGISSISRKLIGDIYMAAQLIQALYNIKKDKRAAETAGVGTPLAFVLWLMFGKNT